MIRQWKNRIIIFPLFVLVAMGICAASVCFADESGNISIKQTTPQIKEIPGMSTEGSRDFVGEAEKQYDFIGTVEDVQNDGIVIGDTYFKKAPGAQISGASKGAHVGLILNSDKEVVLCEPVKKFRR